MWLEAYIEAVSIATVEQLQLEQTDTHARTHACTHTRMHTHSQLYRIPRAATHRGIIIAYYVEVIHAVNAVLYIYIWHPGDYRLTYYKQTDKLGH